MAMKKKLTNVKDYASHAKRALPKPIYDYLCGGADDEWSLENNSSAFDRYELIPQQLRDISNIDTSTKLFEKTIDLPVILSPTGMSRLFHHHKEVGVARAATTAGYPYCLSTMATTSLEDVASHCPGPKIFQIYIHKDRGLTREFIERAKAANYDALCLTVDTAIAGNRERDVKSGFVMPPRFGLSSLLSFAMHPHWSFRLLTNPDFRLANVIHRQDTLGAGAMGVIEYVNSQFDRTVTWSDVEEMIRLWGGPFFIKGVLSAEDAVRARDIGASGLFLSNHGGRQLDGVMAPIDCVAPVRDAIGDDLELVVDGGVRRGTHVVKALALGANAVSFGRPYLYALAAEGQLGLERFLLQFKDEVLRDLALLGCSPINDLRSGNWLRS